MLRKFSKDKLRRLITATISANAICNTYKTALWHGKNFECLC